MLALVLRLWAVSWALPNDQHLFSYHPDEGQNLTRGVMESGVARPHLDLNFYNYGSLYFYLWQGAAAINSSYGVVREPVATQPTKPPTETYRALILVGRLVTVVLGALTVWPVLALGRRLYGLWAGLAAGFAYAVMPAAVVHGHFATVDVPATFFVALSLAAGARILLPDAPRRKGLLVSLSPCLLSGFFAGLAAATKYNCGLVLLAPLAAVWLRPAAPAPSAAGAFAQGDTPVGSPEPNTEHRTSNAEHRLALSTQHSALVLLAAAVGFLVGCPGVLLDWPAFQRDFSYELTKSGQGMGLLFVGTGNGWWYHLVSSLRFGLGVPMLVLALAGVIWALVRRTRADWYLLAFLVPCYLVIGWAQVRYLRYVIPLFPVLAVLAARLACERFEGRRTRPVRGAALAVGAVVGAATLFIALALDRMMTLPPAQDQAYAWVQSNVPRGADIGFATIPWYYTPPFSPLFTAPASPEVHARAAHEVSDYVLRVPAPGVEWDPAVLQPLPSTFVLSDIESEDAARLHLPQAQPFFDTLRSRYAATVFQNTPSVLGLDLGKPAYVPNDWLYIYPRETVYRLR